MSETNWVELYTQPYAEEDTLLNSWIEEQLRHVRWHLWEHQEDMVYMAGELGEGMPPKFKPEARKILEQACEREFGWLIAYMVDRLITEYRLSDIDLDEEMIWQLQEDLPEGGYEEWEEECRKHIFAEHEKYIGHDKAVEYCKSIWKEGWLPE